MARSNRLSGPYRPADVANAFLYNGKKDGTTIDHLKLQKLVYILHGFHLGLRGRPAVGEMFGAWKYGPALESLYHALKVYRSRPIEKYITHYDSDAEEYRAYMVHLSNANFHEVFDIVWTKYSRFTGLQLSAMTHSVGSPWHSAREQGLAYIDNAEIAEHYKRLIDGKAPGFVA